MSILLSLRLCLSNLDFLATLRRHKDVDAVGEDIGGDFRFAHTAADTHALQVVHLVDRVLRIHAHVIHAASPVCLLEILPLVSDLVLVE